MLLVYAVCLAAKYTIAFSYVWYGMAYAWAACKITLNLNVLLTVHARELEACVYERARTQVSKFNEQERNKPRYDWLNDKKYGITR